MIKKALFLSLFLVISACQSNKVRQEVLADKSIPQEYMQAIKENRIMVGMTKRMVIASWGNPCSYCPGTRQTSLGDWWEYNIFGTGSYSYGAGKYLFFDNSGVLKYWKM